MLYVCKECGQTSPKKMGKCFRCGKWDAFVLENNDLKTTDKITQRRDQSQDQGNQTPTQRETTRCPARSPAAPACRSGGRPCRPRSTRGARRRAGRASPRRR